MSGRNWDDRILKTVTFNLSEKGLGIGVVGSIDSDNQSGIFVKYMSPDGLASHDGRLNEGDQLVSVNGQSLENVSCDEAVESLERASEGGFVKLKIRRDNESRQKYREVCSLYSFPRTHSPSVVDTPKKKSNDRNETFLPEEDDGGENKPAGGLQRVDVDRLLESLKYLGVELTEGEEADLRSKVDVDREGTVAYKEFVVLARDLYKTHLLKSSSPKIPCSQQRNWQHSSLSNLDQKSSHFEGSTDLSRILSNRNETITVLEKEILRHKNELHIVREELKNVKCKLGLAEEVRRAARRTEEDYEVVLRHLERDSLKKTYPDLREEVELLQFHQRNAETDNELLKTANEKLMNFVMFVVDALKKRKEQTNIHEALKKSISPPVFLDFSSSDKVILLEAEKALKAVQSLLNIESSLLKDTIGKKRPNNTTNFLYK